MRCTPASLFMKRELCTRLELLKSNCESRVLDSQSAQVQMRGQNSRLRELSLGQKVMARNYGTGETWIPGSVKKRVGPLSYEIETEKGVWHRHIDQIYGKRDHKSC